MEDILEKSASAASSLGPLQRRSGQLLVLKEYIPSSLVGSTKAFEEKNKNEKYEQAMWCVNEENVSPEEEKTGGVPIIGCRGYWHSVLAVRLSYMRSP